MKSNPVKSPPVKRGDFHLVGAQLPPDFPSAHALTLTPYLEITQEDAAVIMELLGEKDILWWAPEEKLVTLGRHGGPGPAYLLPLDDALYIYLLGCIPEVLKQLREQRFEYRGEIGDNQAAIDAILAKLAEDPLAAQQLALDVEEDTYYVC